MALTNLADLERERGCVQAAARYYRTAADLPPAEWAAVTPSDWFQAWVTEPRVECVGLATYMCALLLHQVLTTPDLVLATPGGGGLLSLTPLALPSAHPR